MNTQYCSRSWLLCLLTLSIGREENFKSRRSLREWRGLGRFQKSMAVFNDVWAGQYRPDQAVRWIPNTEEVALGDIDLCGHSCKEGVASFGYAVCQVDWQTGCPEQEPPEGVKPDTALYDLCPKECDEANPDKPAAQTTGAQTTAAATTGQTTGETTGEPKKSNGILDHISVWHIKDGTKNVWDKSKVRIELMPKPNPNIKNDKTRGDHKCDCSGCPKTGVQAGPHMDAHLWSNDKPAAGAKPPAAPAGAPPANAAQSPQPLDPKQQQDKPELSVGSEWFFSGEEERTGADEVCPQCCLDAFKSDYNHVIYHGLDHEKQDKPEVQVGYQSDYIVEH